MKFGDDGRLYAVNPEAGFFGVAPGHRRGDQPERDGHAVARELDLHQLRARPTTATSGGRGMTEEPPAHAIDWHGNDWTPDSDEPAAHPNARFTAPAAQCPSIADEWEDPAACRSTRSCSAAAARPSCRSCARRSTGSTASFLGATMSSETTAAAAGAVGAAALRPVRDAAVLRLQHGRLLRPLAQDRPPRGRRAARRSSTSTGSARTTTASSCGPASARTRASWRGSSAAATARPRPSRRRSASSRRRATSRRTASTSPTRRSRSCSPSTRTSCARSSTQVKEHLAQFGDDLPEEVAAQLEKLEDAAAPRRLASRTMLNGVSAARRTEPNPPATSTSASFAPPAWVPSAGRARLRQRARRADQRRHAVVDRGRPG